ncbi:hypothetical protein J0J21_23365, partial [Vibrio vulnificus]|uniref:hypothetical protein n=1 Tax=Vibrio vulnificus TaxID=672 RepID=UPI0019D4C790
MMKKMNFEFGKGLGKSNQGITVALQTDRKNDLAGIGYKGDRKKGESSGLRRKDVLGDWFMSVGRVSMGLSE